MDFVVAAANSSTPSFSNITAIATGTGDNYRTGDEVEWTKLDVRWSVDSPQVTPSGLINSAYRQRLTIIQWHPDASVTVPSVGVVWDQAITTNEVVNMYSHDKRSLFTVIYDRTVVLGPNGNNGAQVNVSIPQSRAGRKKIKFTGASSLPMDGLYLIVTTDSAAHAGTFTVSTRVWYKDA